MIKTFATALVTSLFLATAAGAVDPDQGRGEPATGWIKEQDQAPFYAPYPQAKNWAALEMPAHTLSQARARNEAIKEGNRDIR